MGEGWFVQGWVHVHGVRTQVVGGVMGGGNGRGCLWLVRIPFALE